VTRYLLIILVTISTLSAGNGDYESENAYTVAKILIEY
jgi:hypothetical protein